MKLRTTKKIITPIGNIITHKSPGGTETRERTGLLGILDTIQAMKNVRQVKEEKEKEAKQKLNKQKTTSPHHSKQIPSKNMKVVGKYKRPSAAKIYNRRGRGVLGEIFHIPQPPDGKRFQYKQLCLRKVKNKNQAYFAPVGTCWSYRPNSGI